MHVVFRVQHDLLNLHVTRHIYTPAYHKCSFTRGNKQRRSLKEGGDERLLARDFNFSLFLEYVLHKRLTTNVWSPIGLYCVSCTKFGKLTCRKIIQIVATRCHILRLKCSKFDFGWGSSRTALPAGLGPRSRWESFQRSPNLLAGFEGSYF